MDIFTEKIDEGNTELFYKNINFLITNKNSDDKATNKEKIEIFELLYKNYNFNKNIKSLINTILNKAIKHNKEQSYNSLEENINTYYYKESINYLSKIKEILNFNRKDFNNYKKYLNDYSIIVDLMVNCNDADYININKQDELYLLTQNKDYLEKLFNDIIENYKDSIYVENTYKKDTEEYEDYTDCLYFFMNLKERIINLKKFKYSTFYKKENAKLYRFLLKNINKEFLAFEFIYSRDKFNYIIDKLKTDSNTQELEKLIMELEFKATYCKEVFIKDRIDYFVKTYYYNQYETNTTRISVLHILYNAYRSEYKDLINNSLEEIKQNYKLNNGELAKTYIGILNKFKKVINLDSKQFSKFIDKLNLIKSINILFENSEFERITVKNNYINVIKHIQEDKNNVLNAFKNTRNIFNLNIYLYNKINNKSFSAEDYNSVIETINIIESTIFKVADIYNINYTEEDENKQAEFILKKIIYNKVPKNKKELYDSFIYLVYFEFRENRNDLFEILDNIKLDILKEKTTLEQIDYYLKYIDSLKYYYSDNFHLNYLSNSKQTLTKFIEYFIYDKDDVFKIGIMDIINKYKDTILNDVLPNLIQGTKTKLLKESILNIDNITDKEINKEIQNKETNQTQKTKNEIKLIKQLMYREILDNVKNYKLFNNHKNIDIIKNKLYKVYEALFYYKIRIIEIDYLLDNYDNILLSDLETLLIYGSYEKLLLKNIIENERIVFNRYLHDYYIDEEDIHATQITKQRIDKLDNLEFDIFTEISLLKRNNLTKTIKNFIQFLLKYDNKDNKKYNKRINYINKVISTINKYNKEEFNIIKEELKNINKNNKQEYHNFIKIIDFIKNQNKKEDNEVRDLLKNLITNKPESYKDSYNILLKYNKQTFEERYKELKDEFEGKEDKNKIKQKDIIQLETEGKQKTNKQKIPIKNKLTKKQIKHHLEQLEIIKTDFNTKIYISKDFYREQKLIKNSIYYLINNYNLNYKENINKEIIKFLILEIKFDSKNVFNIIDSIRTLYKYKLCNNNRNNNENNYTNKILLNRINTNIDDIMEELDI